MNRALFSELKYKMFRSGSRMHLFIGINLIVFLIISLIRVGEFLFSNTKETPISEWINMQLSMPAYLPDLLYKPWTPFTYMFTHSLEDFFHILFNMLWLYWMGRIFEDFLNQRQFTFTYLAGGLVGALFFILSYNLFPAFQGDVQGAVILGASASVSAIVIATATLVPEYTISLLFFGLVRLKYLALAYILLDLVTIAGLNPGGSIAHLGGAFLGFIFIKSLNRGHDWSKIFRKRSRLKVIRNNKSNSASSASKLPDQETIDRILDKISQSGYNSLTKQEKEQLFKASDKK
jgi:membrane associated rhomboid family serine protease